MNMQQMLAQAQKMQRELQKAMNELKNAGAEAINERITGRAGGLF